jgi:hypothetical protein
MTRRTKKEHVMVFCSNANNPAKRRYLRRSAGVMMSYMGLVSVSHTSVHRWHPQGWHLYLAAALPTIPILCLAYVVGRYLREEKDEYQRDIVIRGMLWGTAAALSVTVFSGFLQAYGWTGQLPAFSEFILFWVTALIVKVYYRFTDRSSDE